MRRVPCLTNTQLMRILSSSVPPDEAAGVEEHLDDCADCRAVLVDLVKALPESTPGQSPSPP